MFILDGSNRQQKTNSSQPSAVTRKYLSVTPHSTTNATQVTMATKGDDRLTEQDQYNSTHGPNAQYTRHLLERQRDIQAGQFRQVQHLPDSSQYLSQSSMLLNTTQFPSNSPGIQHQTLAMSPKPSPSLMGSHGSTGTVGIGLQPAMMQAPVYASQAPVIGQAAQPPAAATHLSRSHVLRENEPSPLLSENYDCLSDDDT